MQESLSSEHSGELFRDSLEELLNGGGVADESGGHLQTTRRNVANGGLEAEEGKNWVSEAKIVRELRRAQRTLCQCNYDERNHCFRTKNSERAFGV